MTLPERVGAASEMRSWAGSIPLRYEYTAGVAGEVFLRGLKEGRILAGYCPSCRSAALPARTYCVDCFTATSEFVPAGPVGLVKAVTRKKGAGGETVSFGFVEFPGTKGGLVHRLLPGVRAGSKVRAVFKAKARRRGAVSDIAGFERAV